jgi:hypothetical protein
MSTEDFLPRRIKNEIKRDWDFPNGIYERFVLDKIEKETLNYGTIKLFFRVKFIDKYEIVTIIINNNDYPWKPPDILVNNYKYKQLICVDYKLLEKLKIPIKCLCCSTILCDWQPLHTFVDILNELVTFLDIKKRTVEMMFCEKIMHKYFGFYLPIVEYI